MMHSATPAFIRWLDRLSSKKAILLGYSFVLMLALLDYATAIEVSFSVFYLIPVIIVAWRSSMRAAILMSLISAALWESIEVLGGQRFSALWIYFWNPGTRFVFYSLVSFLILRLRELHEELFRQARIDAVTGIGNRRAFIETLEMELAQHRRSGGSLSIAFVDIDHFKQVNDTLGHQMGDRVLKEVAEMLRSRLRKSDTIGRMGGDEFAILMPQTDGSGALAALSAIRVQKPAERNRLTMPVTFSTGIVTGSGRVSADQLLHEADLLMYEVKQNGRNEIRQRNSQGAELLLHLN